MLRAKGQEQRLGPAGKHRLLAPVLLACLLQGLVGCGTPGSPGAGTPSGIAAESPSDPAGPPSDSSSPAASASASGTSSARLTVQIKDSPDSPAATSFLVCNGTSATTESTVVDADSACAALEKHGAVLLAPAAVRDQKCTMQMGSSRVATVSGTFHGKDVKDSFSQTDGCKIAVWNMLAPLLGGQAGER
ncbi:hypothetical protein IV498_15420 [Paenarthrobacter sp. Z7-10]|nr:hypothetical protein [Paenarthrobacter sp. Z7-10]